MKKLTTPTTVYENIQFFYATDNLGSVTWVTNSAGNAIQHIQYLPFGELFISQQNSSFDSRYKFSGKELDTETGYSYFGARYLDSDLSIWLSVDPMADKYPGLSPYNYCANNPVMLRDPDGRVIVDPRNGRQVARVNGEWKTIKRYNKNGNAVYGNVSNKFVSSSQPVLDDMISTQAGMDIYNAFQETPTDVAFDKHDSYNLEALRLYPSNSKFSPASGKYRTDKNGNYKGRMIVTPDIDAIKASAAKDGIDYMEKFLQVMEVEKTHITDPAQIAIEKSYNFDLNQSTQSKQDCYTNPLNNAIRVGKQYRNEMNQTIDGSSNIPVTRYNQNNGTNIPIR